MTQVAMPCHTKAGIIIISFNPVDLKNHRQLTIKTISVAVMHLAIAQHII